LSRPRPCSQMPLEAAVCRWSRDIRGMDLADLSTQNEHNLAGMTVLEARSRVTQSRVYACVGDVVTVVEALGVDAEQHFDAVPGALGDPRRRHPRA
jgi:PAB1-binding protein PBP1